jgi:pimeloyl-ACP methyl ester carboxylesterase
MGVARIDGVALEVKTIPGGAGRPWLVLLHEGLGCVALWRDFPELIARRTGCPVLVFSRRGYGASDGLARSRTPSFMHEEALQVLPGLLAHYGIDRPVLIGHSDGASIALIHAASGPQAVRGAVLMAPHVVVEEITLQSIARVAAAYSSSGLRDRLARYHAHVDDAFRGWADIWLDPAFRDWSLLAECERLTVPLLLIQGSDDEYGTLIQLDLIEQSAKATIRRLVLENCGHSPQRDREVDVAAAIAAFVGDLPDP